VVGLRASGRKMAGRNLYKGSRTSSRANAQSLIKGQGGSMDLNGKVAIVTGGASGIGAATCRAFAAAGAKVVVTDINADGATKVAAEIGALAVPCDVGDEAQVNALVQSAEAALGPVDVFFSNAAIATGNGPLDTSIEDWNAQWQVNVLAHVFAVRAVLPSMLDRETGYLIHTASMAGILTSHGNLPYAATKHAVVGLAEWLSVTYHDKGVRVSLLAPLGVNTPMLSGAGTAFAEVAAGPVKEPEEVAQQVLNAVRAEQFLILTDPIAQTWMERKTNDPERWLKGMRRMQAKIDSMQ
jgi:NAD(P)-dependent dehydrogenase (short-subunit alcohol dehydrogenase family)